jgi:hypothetical protein
MSKNLWTLATPLGPKAMTFRDVLAFKRSRWKVFSGPHTASGAGDFVDEIGADGFCDLAA